MPLPPYKTEAQNTLFITASYRCLCVYINLSDLFHFVQGSGGEGTIYGSFTYLVLPAHLPPCLLSWAMIITGCTITRSVSIPVKNSFFLNADICEKMRKGPELYIYIYITQAQFIHNIKHKEILEVICADSLLRLFQYIPLLRPAGLTTHLFLCILGLSWI